MLLRIPECFGMLIGLTSPGKAIRAAAICISKNMPIMFLWIPNISFDEATRANRKAEATVFGSMVLCRNLQRIWRASQ